MYKEIEVRAIMGAIHSAAGNKKGAKAAQGFRFHKKKNERAKEADVRKVFGSADTIDAGFTPDAIEAEIARQKAILA
jgi:hypothetical protein